MGLFSIKPDLPLVIVLDRVLRHGRKKANKKVSSDTPPTYPESPFTKFTVNRLLAPHTGRSHHHCPLTLVLPARSQASVQSSFLHSQV
eukprot:45154-Eustigmatos_ZCMA.PRE.1